MDEAFVTFADLVRFYREVMMPDIVAQIATPIRDEIAALRRDNDAHFDAIYKRFERVDSDLMEVKAGFGRIEDRIDASR